MRRWVEHLLEDEAIGGMVAHRVTLEPSEASFGRLERPLPAAIRDALRQSGIDRLYRHQAESIDASRAGRNVLVATPTASGKTLVFALPVLEAALEDPSATALLLYPTKALARDQVAGLRRLARATAPLRPPTVDVYDGDTPRHLRPRIRRDPPNLLVSNPDMLHHGILSNHRDWAELLRGLRFVVLDEMHVYRGLFGAHVHHILARLRRLCEAYGARPRFIGASATIGNPEDFAQALTGEAFQVVRDSGAPSARRDVVVLNPVAVSPYTAALRVLARAADAAHPTIAFTKSRRVAELLNAWLVRQQPSLADRVAAYRAGYLPEERRAIERRLFSGDLDAVIATSALELGIDVGALDVCVLVGYPGSRMAAWQRIGRVGRAGRPALAVVITMPDALDQYVASHPELLFDGAFESVVVDPSNTFVALPHVVCAAAERPIDRADFARAPRLEQWVESLARDGRVLAREDGDAWYSTRRRPHRDVQPRSVAAPFQIVSAADGRSIGTVDAARVYQECHPEAIYLHAGRSFRVVELDVDRRRAIVEPFAGTYYTVVLGDKETRVLEDLERSSVAGLDTALSRLEVTIRVVGYQRKRLSDGEALSEHPIDAPPRVFETVGMRVELPTDWERTFAAHDLHFMGSIHATEHAAIALFPLLAIADRGDVGGISYTHHPQVGGPTFFLYDALAGGAGLAERAFRELDGLAARVRAHVRGCECEDGCPACIQSPRCGNGNRPLDKAGCLAILDHLCGDARGPTEALATAPAESATPEPARPQTTSNGGRGDESMPRRRHGIRRRIPEDRQVASRETAVRSISRPHRRSVPPGMPLEPPPVGPPADASVEAGVATVSGIAAASMSSASPHPEPARLVEGESGVVVFDLETRRGADEVGGWSRIDAMGLALAVVYDIDHDTYTTYLERDVDRLIADLALAERVVGFNVDRFDLRVLSAYTRRDLRRIRTVDMLAHIHDRLGFRVSLNHLASENLGVTKSADGLQSLRWFKEGRLDLIESYCRKDVEVTLRLWRLGRERGYVLFRGRDERSLRIPVSW